MGGGLCRSVSWCFGSSSTRWWHTWLPAALLLALLAAVAGCSAAPSDTPAPAATLTVPPTVTPAPSATPTVPLPDPALCWVAYSPTNYSPDVGQLPSTTSLRADLALLYDAGFRGLMTYRAEHSLAALPQLAHEAGFAQVIMGVWDPLSEDEVATAIAAAPAVDGYIVGFEGVGDHNYALADLRQVLARVRGETGRAVTTAERIDDYFDGDELLELGDWLAPIVHPYWANQIEPAQAVQWTAVQYGNLRGRAGPGRMILLSEVGLPSAGDPRVSEAAQAAYYQALQQAQVPFTYLEAFDQTGKTRRPVEPFWGLFDAQRAPKPAAGCVCGRTPGQQPTARATPTPAAGIAL